MQDFISHYWLVFVVLGIFVIAYLVKKVLKARDAQTANLIDKARMVALLQIAEAELTGQDATEHKEKYAEFEKERIRLTKKTK